MVLCSEMGEYLFIYSESALFDVLTPMKESKLQDGY